VFLAFCQGRGKGVEEITREDLEAFIEHEQDRGLNISTVRTRMASVTAFLHFLMGRTLSPVPSQSRRSSSGSLIRSPVP
jgi:site-specific recombinase XerD